MDPYDSPLSSPIVVPITHSPLPTKNQKDKAPKAASKTWASASGSEVAGFRGFGL